MNGFAEHSAEPLLFGNAQSGLEKIPARKHRLVIVAVLTNT
jgi:hypothetical protein